MTTAERTVLQILERQGPLSLYQVDRRFVRKQVEGFAPRVLTDLVTAGMVNVSDGVYAISKAGRDALIQDAA